MARVFRQDTGQLIGQLGELRGPLQAWITEWPFRAWRHPDGTLRNYPSVARPERWVKKPAYIEIRIPVRNADDGEIEVLVPLEHLDFILHHTGLPKP